MKRVGIRLHEVRKTYAGAQGPVTAVDAVSLEIQPGEFVTLLGPSGCGKTTTLRMIAGFEEITSGTIHVGERDVTHLPPQQRDTPMVFQSYALFPHLSVFENALFGLRTRHVPDAEARQRVRAMAETMGLGALLERGAGELSGGQQQRVALLRALVTEPTVLLFDEPLSNLDVQMRVSLRQEIRALQQRLGITAIYVTHDQNEAMSLSDRVVVMNRGKIAQVATPTELYFLPTSRFVAEFVGDANFIPVQISTRADSQATLETPWGRQTARVTASHGAASRAIWVVRPESLSLGAKGGVAGTVKSATFLGSDWLCEVGVGALTLRLRVLASHGTTYAVGSEVRVLLNDQPRAVLLED